MRKALLIMCIALIASTGVFASFDGRTSAGINYSYDKGNEFGMSVDSIGYINEGIIGYYIGVDADFSFSDISLFDISLLAGPAYRYRFNDAPVDFELAIGISGNTTAESILSFGLGAYAGIAWHCTELVDLLAGVKLGSNFVELSFADGFQSGVKGNFYVTPVIAAGFAY